MWQSVAGACGYWDGQSQGGNAEPLTVRGLSADYFRQMASSTFPSHFLKTCSDCPQTIFGKSSYGNRYELQTSTQHEFLLTQ